MKKTIRFGIAMAIAIVIVLAFPLAALASSVDVAVVDVTAPTGSVTLAPGGSGGITINMTVTGNQVGTATFKVNRDWTLSGGVFNGSNPQTFTVNPRAAQDPATTFSTSGTVNVAVGQGAGTFTLAVSAFDITNTNTTGAKLADGADSNYQVTVVVPTDTTPPVITPNISGTLGNNSWYVSDVTVSWTINDPESAVTSTIGNETTIINYDTAGVTLTCTATSAGGTNSVSVTIKRDATAPVIDASRDPASNANGWNNTDVTVSYEASDAMSGIDESASHMEDDVLSAEGAGQSASGTAVDMAGNEASATIDDINIDKTSPVITINVPGNGAVYSLNQSVIADWSASDGLSGIASSSGTVPSGSAIDTATVGPKTFTVNAEDNAGNVNTKSVTYKVAYIFGGILQPIDADGSSIFKLGSTIPVKFQLTDASGAYISNAVATITVKKISDGIIGDELEAVSTSAATTGNLFRYDVTSNQYIFNLSTKLLTKGTWQIKITLNDGNSYLVLISLK